MTSKPTHTSAHVSPPSSTAPSISTNSSSVLPKQERKKKKREKMQEGRKPTLVTDQQHVLHRGSAHEPQPGPKDASKKGRRGWQPRKRRREIERLYPICPAIAAAPTPSAPIASTCVSLHGGSRPTGQAAGRRERAHRECQVRKRRVGGCCGRGREGKGLGDRQTQGDMHNLVFFISSSVLSFSSRGDRERGTDGQYRNLLRGKKEKCGC